MARIDLEYGIAEITLPVDPKDYLLNVVLKAYQKSFSLEQFNIIKSYIEQGKLWGLIPLTIGYINIADLVEASKDVVKQIVKSYKNNIIEEIEKRGFEVLGFDIKDVTVEPHWGEITVISSYEIPYLGWQTPSLSIPVLESVDIKIRFSYYGFKKPETTVGGIGLVIIVVAIIAVIGAIIAVKIYTDKVSYLIEQRDERHYEFLSEISDKVLQDIIKLKDEYRKKYGDNWYENPNIRSMYETDVQAIIQHYTNLVQQETQTYQQVQQQLQEKLTYVPPAPPLTKPPIPTVTPPLDLEKIKQILLISGIGIVGLIGLKILYDITKKK